MGCTLSDTGRLWLQAARPRTLPLAAAGIFAGALMAAQQQRFQAAVLLLSLLTALLLQVFGNLANDYGDARHGADRHRHSDAPRRLVASGLINAAAMRRALRLCAGLCLLSGLWLLATALPALSGAIASWWSWLALGALCLAAAWAYTAGPHPYGYAGWGDMAVWLFFGPVAVLGSAALHGASIGVPEAAAATAVGLWCAAVLNINNLRDRRHDRAAGKLTLAVRLGLRRALLYHTALLLLAALAWGLWLHSCLPAAATILSSLLLAGFYLDHGRSLCRAVRNDDVAAHNRQLAKLSAFVLAWVSVQALLWYGF